jgi:hypothetical protein
MEAVHFSETSLNFYHITLLPFSMVTAVRTSRFQIEGTHLNSKCRSPPVETVGRTLAIKTQHLCSGELRFWDLLTCSLDRPTAAGCNKRWVPWVDTCPRNKPPQYFLATSSSLSRPFIKQHYHRDVSIRTFRRNILHPSSGTKNKLNKWQEQAVVTSLVSCGLFARLTILSWRWIQYVPSKCRRNSIWLHCIK